MLLVFSIKIVFISNVNDKPKKDVQLLTLLHSHRSKQFSFDPFADVPRAQLVFRAVYLNTSINDQNDKHKTNSIKNGIHNRLKEQMGKNANAR